MIVERVPATSGSQSPLWLLAAGPAVGVGTDWALYRCYRNPDKSHAFERDTIIAAQPVRGQDEKVDRIGRTTDSTIDGDNSEKHRQRVERLR